MFVTDEASRDRALTWSLYLRKYVTLNGVARPHRVSNQQCSRAVETGTAMPSK